MLLKPRTVDFVETWKTLLETVKGVITLGHVPRTTWNDRFWDVYALCVAYPESLADRLLEETINFLKEHVSTLLEDVKSDGDNMLLQNYYSTWKMYYEGVWYLHQLYFYFNQQHVKKPEADSTEEDEKEMKIGELGMHIWRTNMITPLEQQLIKLLLEAVAQHRGNRVSTVPIKTVCGTIHSFVQVQEHKKKNKLQLYEEFFEKQFLDVSTEYYKREAAKFLQECDVSMYIERVMQKLDEEYRLSCCFLPTSSFLKVREKCEQYMVAEHLNFLNSECDLMVQNERIKDLRKMYVLLRNIPTGHSVLLQTVLEHIRAQGLHAVENVRKENTSIHFVENMLRVHERYTALIKDVFKGDQIFVSALDKACSSVINHQGEKTKQYCSSPELLARYCDLLLRKSSKSFNEIEIENRLVQSMIIFKYLDDKDIFQKFYSRMLAKRLIHQKSQNMDAEEAMINRFKQACGYEFTNKLHRMYVDMSVSADLNNKFNEYLRNEKIELAVSFSSHILQQGAWPLSQSAISTLGLPQHLEKAMEKFKIFYHTQFSGRKLTWLHQLCQAELKLGYLRKSYFVTVQTFQMIVLLVFETIDRISYQDLLNTLQLNTEHLQRYVQSLIDCRLLLCDTCGDNSKIELTPETVLRLNFNYNNKRTKFHVTAAVQKDSPQEVEQTISSVEEDRKLYLQAAIVRIMKARKILRHNELIQEVCAQSKASFAPSISIIKKCIGALIDKQYIERTEHSDEEYSYVA